MKVQLLEHTPNPLDVIYSACRQCYSPGFVGDTYKEESKKTKEKLIKQVISSGHTSTVEHVSFTFAISEVSRILTHQLVRHRIGISFSQQSQRYTGKSKDLNREDFVVPPTIQKNEKALKMYYDYIDQLCHNYARMNEEFPDIPAEDLRFLLPSGIKTNIVVTMNCRSLLNFFSERCCSCAQWEIRTLAYRMKEIVDEILPEVFKGYGPKCDHFKYCPEPKLRHCGRMPHQSKYLQR